MKDQNKNMRIAIADDHEIYRMGLKLLLNSMPDMEVLIEVESGNRLLQALESTSVDLVILDQSMQDGTGLDFLKALSAMEKPPQVILLTGSSGSAILHEAKSLGAVAVVAKQGSGDELVKALEAVQKNCFYVSPAFADLVETDNVLDLLTAREREVLTLIIQGQSTRAIATVLNVSFKTIDTHRSRLMNKLDLHSVAELMQFAREVGLLERQ